MPAPLSVTDSLLPFRTYALESRRRPSRRLRPLATLKILIAIVRLTRDPSRLDQVFQIAGLASASPELDRMLVDLKREPKFAQALARRTRVGTVDLERLAEFPEGSVGRRYAEFMRSRNLRHEALELVDGESEFDFLRNHLRETHDLWHVLTDFDTDVAGELGLQAFYVAQFRTPLGILMLAIGMLNTLLVAMDDRERRLSAIVKGWLLGKRARSLLGIPWALHWTTSVAELRRELRLDLTTVEQLLPASGARAA